MKLSYGQKVHAGPLGQRFFKENVDSHSPDPSVSGDEGHSNPLRVAAEAGARLSTPASVML